MGEQTNRAEVARGLRKALPLQHRCALAFAVAAGTLPGPDGVALSGMLRSGRRTSSRTWSESRDAS